MFKIPKTIFCVSQLIYRPFFSIVNIFQKKKKNNHVTEKERNISIDSQDLRLHAAGYIISSGNEKKEFHPFFSII